LREVWLLAAAHRHQPIAAPPKTPGKSQKGYLFYNTVVSDSMAEAKVPARSPIGGVLSPSSPDLELELESRWDTKTSSRIAKQRMKFLPKMQVIAKNLG